MAWKLVNPNITNDPSYLDPRLSDDESKISSNTTSLAQKAQQLDLTNFINARNKSFVPKRLNYLLYDSFYRADSTTAIGNAETNNTAYTLVSAGTGVAWGISNNQAYNPSFTTSGRSVALQQLNESDGILEVDFTLGNGTAQCGLGFRYTDINNFWYIVVTSTYFSLGKYVAGNATNLVQPLKNFQSGSKLSLVMKGNRIEVYVDGVFLTRQYDSFNATATQHGLFSRGDDPAFRWDNLCFKPSSVEVPYYLNDDFEGSTFKWYYSQQSAGLSYSLGFNTSIKETGTQSFRAELNYSDPVSNVGKHRSELAMPPEQPLEEHWYGVSIYLPNGGIEDYANDTSPEIVMQWHGQPDSGEEDVSPPLSLQTENGMWRINQTWDIRKTSVQATGLNFYSQEIGSYAVDKGKWTQWVFHVKWGWLSSQQPILEVYKNGVLVFQRNGLPNCLNDSSGVYPKLGIYKWDWDTTTTQVSKRVVYYDNYWMI